MPELENGPIAIFRKSARYVGFQIESALPLCLSGMTYNIYDNVGNGAIEEYGFAKEVKEITPYMQAVMNEKISFADLKGVVIPIDEKITYHKEIKNSFYDLETLRLYRLNIFTDDILTLKELKITEGAPIANVAKIITVNVSEDAIKKG
jgi:hypothetical protein